MLNKLFGRRRWQDQAHSLYGVVMAQARLPEFYTRCGVPDSVDGRFDLLALHCFLVLHRLRQGGAETTELSQALFDLMFADMDQGLREMGVSDVSVGGRIKEMVTAFYGRINAYDAGLADPTTLEAALARNLYRGEPVAEGVLATVAAYVRGQADLLAAQDIEDFKQGRVRFGALTTP